MLMMEVILFSQTSVLAKATQCDIPEDGILHSHCCVEENIWTKEGWSDGRVEKAA
jgi:hypothetical protein